MGIKSYPLSICPCLRIWLPISVGKSDFDFTLYILETYSPVLAILINSDNYLILVSPVQILTQLNAKVNSNKPWISMNYQLYISMWIVINMFFIHRWFCCHIELVPEPGSVFINYMQLNNWHSNSVEVTETVKHVSVVFERTPKQDINTC